MFQLQAHKQNTFFPPSIPFPPEFLQLQQWWHLYWFAILGSTSIVIHSVKQCLLRNWPGSDAVTSHDFMRERLQRAFTRATSFTELPNSLVVIFCLWPLCIAWHFPSSPKETFSWLHQIKPRNISFCPNSRCVIFSPLTLLFSTAWFKLGLQIAYSVLVVFWLTRRSWVREKMRFGASYSTSNKLLLIARHILTMGLQICL